MQDKRFFIHTICTATSKLLFPLNFVSKRGLRRGNSLEVRKRGPIISFWQRFFAVLCLALIDILSDKLPLPPHPCSRRIKVPAGETLKRPREKNREAIAKWFRVRAYHPAAPQVQILRTPSTLFSIYIVEIGSVVAVGIRKGRK